VDPIGVVGEWASTPNKTFAAPVCCGWDASLLNPPICGIENYQEFGGHACMCSDFTDEYTWKEPGLPDFDPVETCQLLGNRTVSFIGDSTMQQTAATLMNALHSHVCKRQVSFLHSDTLVDRNYGKSNRGKHWRQAIDDMLQAPDIVILSTGAHIPGVTSFKRVVREVLEGIQNVTKTTYPNTTFVWKTQMPGGCTPEIAFKNDPARAAKESNFTNANRYNHKQFYGRDLFALSLLQKLEMPSLDMRALYSRSDAHPSSRAKTSPDVDCLHMCSPGPLDIIAPMFQRLLTQIG
jgi:hypothetical protein